MEGNNCSSNIVLLMDTYSEESKKLHQSFLLSGCECCAAVIEDSGFLPEGVMSVYGYFLGEFQKEPSLPQKPVYFNRIQVPKYWEISGNNTSGCVHELTKERAKIFYAEPKHKRFVRVVDWYDDRGVVRFSEHYNQYGALYARTIYDANGHRVNKAFFSPKGEEIIVENYITGDIVLNEKTGTRIFHTKTEFVLYFIRVTGNEGKRLYFNSLSTPFFVSQRLKAGEKKDILFWQEPVRDEIPGNMKIILEGHAARTESIFVQSRQAYERLLALGAPKDRISLMGFCYPFARENKNRAQALICTNSDRLEQCRRLIQSLPQMQFHIAALTEMSSKLLSLGEYRNVKLYPGIKNTILEELFQECDYYLDINYGGEISSSVYRAFLQNQMIFAFKETLHYEEYVAKEYVYPASGAEDMISELRNTLEKKEAAEEHLTKQRQMALAEWKQRYAAMGEG